VVKRMQASASFPSAG